MFTLFDDQIAIENLVLSYFAKGIRRVIMCAPTGSGKTVTFCDIVHKALQKGKRVLVLCHLDELIISAKEKLNEYGIFPHLIIKGSKDNLNSICDVASVATIRKRMLKQYDLVVVDECHRCDFDSVLLRLIELFNPFIIGVSASPIRTGAMMALDKIYEVIAEVATIKQLIAAKRLTPGKFYSVKRDFSHVKLTGGDYDIEAISKEFNKAEMYTGMLEKYKQFADGKKTIIFNSNIENSKITSDLFRENGYECAHVDGKTPEWKRRDVLLDLKHKPGMIVTNRYLYSTGLDEDSLEALIQNFATTSLPIHLQTNGRAARKHPSKQHFISIDMGGNCYKHGLWHFDRKWTLTKNPKGKSDGVAGVKICTACQVINSSSARKCCECGVVFEVEKKALKDGEFVEITGDLERGVEQVFNARTASLTDLKRYAKQKGYASGWAYVQHNLNAKRKESEPMERGATPIGGGSR